MSSGESATTEHDLTREEYIKSLKIWLDKQYILCSGLAAHNNIFNVPYSTPNRIFDIHNLNNQQPRDILNGNPRNLNFSPGTYEFVIPPMWKRFVAEVIDFAFLFLIKLFITFVAVEAFQFITVENYGFDTIEKYLQNPKIAMQMSVEILSLELLHRCIVCCYEVYWLRGGPCATPGKRYMGLIVIQVENIIPVPGPNENKIRVNPCTCLGFQQALTRAILKNLFIGFMLPICFTMYIFRFNRTCYDVISKSIVVEYNQNMHPID